MGKGRQAVKEARREAAGSVRIRVERTRIERERARLVRSGPDPTRGRPPVGFAGRGGGDETGATWPSVDGQERRRWRLLPSGTAPSGREGAAGAENEVGGGG